MKEYFIIGIVFLFALFSGVLAVQHIQTTRIYDCSMAEFHPDYSPEMRRICREKRSIKL